MKRIISLLLCAALILSSVTVFAENESSQIDDDCIKAADMLSALKIVEDIDDTFDSDKSVTRGEFACYVAKLIKAEYTGTEIFYYDVPKHHYAYDAVYTLTELGYISGKGDKLFSPDESITSCDAYSVLIKILGYDVYMQNTGDYETICYKTATSLKLSKDCSNKTYLTMQDLVFLLRNSLLINMLEVKSSSYGKFEFKQNENKTLLSVYYDSYYNEGTFTAIGNIGLYGNKTLKDGRIEIDDIDYETNGIDYEEFFGCEVSYIYKEVENGERSIIWIYPKKQNNIIEFYVCDNSCTLDESSMTLSFYESEESSNQRKEKISQNATVIYNGENYTGSLKNLLSGDNLTVKLVSTKNSSGYDIIIITSYEIFAVDAINSNDMVLYGDNQKEYSFDKNKIDYLDIKNESAMRMDFSKIKEDDVVSYSKSNSGNAVKALVTHKTVSGKVEGILYSDSYTEYIINSIPYKCMKSEVNSKIKNNDTVILYLDAFSYIYDVSVTYTDTFLAFIMNVSDDSANEVTYVKLIDENDKINIYPIAQKATVCGIRCNKYDESLALLKTNGVVKYQLVSCKLNKNNELIKIETQSDNGDLKLDQPQEKVLYKSNSQKFGTKIIIGDNTKIFAVPSLYDMPDAKEEDFSVKKKYQVANDTDYYVESYYLGDEEKEFADAVIIYNHDWSASSSSTSCVLIEKINSVVNAENEVVDCLVGYKGSEAVQLMTKNDYRITDYKSGDVVRVSQNSANEITKLDLVYSIDKKSYDTTQYSSSVNNSLRLLVVHANDRIGSVVKTGYNSGADFDELFNLKNVKILVYDKNERNGNITLGTYADIMTYKTVNDDCSDMVIQTNYGNIIFVAIYK